MQTKYTVLERLGGGGQAEVFRGVAESMEGFKKAVAIKRVLPNLTKNQKFVSMFLDEARLSLFLQHANIVQVFDISKADDGTLLPRHGVRRRLQPQGADRAPASRTTIRDIGLALYIMIEGCKGLNYAHTLEHPETGAAARHRASRHLAAEHPAVEERRGEARRLRAREGEQPARDHRPGRREGQVQLPVARGGARRGGRRAHRRVRARHHPVGAAHRPPAVLRRRPYETVELVRQARVPSIAALNPKIAPELEAIVRKALARDPDERYQTAADLGDALAQYLFANELKVTSRDIAMAVRETQVERKRAAKPKDSLIDALIMDELARMCSMIEDELVGQAGRAHARRRSSSTPPTGRRTCSTSEPASHGAITPRAMRISINARVNRGPSFEAMCDVSGHWKVAQGRLVAKVDRDRVGARGEPIPESAPSGSRFSSRGPPLVAGRHPQINDVPPRAWIALTERLALPSASASHAARRRSAGVPGVERLPWRRRARRGRRASSRRTACGPHASRRTAASASRGPRRGARARATRRPTPARLDSAPCRQPALGHRTRCAPAAPVRSRSGVLAMQSRREKPSSVVSTSATPRNSGSAARSRSEPSRLACRRSRAAPSASRAAPRRNASAENASWIRDAPSTGNACGAIHRTRPRCHAHAYSSSLTDG